METNIEHQAEFNGQDDTPRQTGNRIISRRAALYSAIAGTFGASFATFVAPGARVHAQSEKQAPQPPNLQADNCVATIAELKALKPWRTGEECVNVLGYNAPND